jgi:O-antigen ligase
MTPADLDPPLRRLSSRDLAEVAPGTGRPAFHRHRGGPVAPPLGDGRRTLPRRTSHRVDGRIARADHAAREKPLRGDERTALVAIGAVTALLPLLKPGGPFNLAPVDALIVVALLASVLWARTTCARLRFPYLIPVGLALAGGTIGALLGPVPQASAIALIQDIWLVLWCWALFNLSRTARNFRIVMSAWVYSGLVWAALLIIGIITSQPLLTGVTARNGGRVQLTFGDPNYAANYFFITLMLVWATQRPRRRWARLGAYVALLVVIAFTGSNGAALSLLAGGSIAVVGGVWRRAGAAPALVVLALLAVSGGLISSNFSLRGIENRAASSNYAFIRNGLGRGTSVSQRGQLFNESIRLYKAGSVFGEGPNSTKSRLSKDMATFDKQAHDDYLAALMERGFIGFAGVLLLAGILLLRAGGVVREGLRNGYEAVLVRPNALLGAVAGTLVAASVYGVLHNRHIWTLFAITAAASFWGRGYE